MKAAMGNPIGPVLQSFSVVALFDFYKGNVL
jgi:hypothetical protein